MYSLELFLRNSENPSPTQYVVQDLYFQDFFIGRRREALNLLMIRKIIEGVILIKNPADFDALEDYIYSPQDAQFTIDSVRYNSLVKFSEPNFTTKRVNIELTLIDDYSKMTDGVTWNSWTQTQQPTISKKYKINEFQIDVDTNFVDGSQYMFDAEVPGSELWGTETETFNLVNKEVYIADTLLFDIGGDSQSGDPLTIDMLIPEVELLDEYYKPTYIKWQDHQGANDYFDQVSVIFKREFRYFEESEIVPEGWNSVTGTREKNGFTYNKFVRPLYEDQTYLSGENIYFIRDEFSGFDYVTAEFAGINTEIQKSYKFYNTNDLLRQLIGAANFDLTDFSSIIPIDYFICILKNYNDYKAGIDQFKLEPFINTLRDKFRIYFEYNNTDLTADFKYLDFPDKLLDIDNYRSTDFIPNIDVVLNEVPKIVDFTTNAWQLDFKSQKVTFYGKNQIEESKALEISTDIEDTSTSADELIMIKTRDVFQDQIYERFILSGSQNGTEALFRSADGKFISWNDDDLGLATYLEFEAYSNTIYLDIDDEIHLSFVYHIRSGSVRVSIGDYVANLGTFGTKDIITTGSSTERLRIYVSNQAGGNVDGFLSNLTVKVKTKTPELETGIISGRNLKNGEMSAANTIVEKKPLLSYPHGFLENHSSIDCNPVYAKEINFKINLGFDLFDWDINKFMELDSEEYITFEEKRQILTDENTGQSKISKYSTIKAKSNNII